MAILLRNYTPSTSEVEKYLQKWEMMESYKAQEEALDKLFFHLCPNNVALEDILLKCATLNDFYSTNIFDIYSVARHIQQIPNLDERLLQGDRSLVEEISKAKVGREHMPRTFYSFATKYCSHHQPKKYAIYDNYVDKVLMAFKKRDGFAKFTQKDLKDYPTYHDIILAFQQYYNLTGYDLKQMDKYLWQYGREQLGNK